MDQRKFTLDDILGDSLTSTYVNDAFYAMLRHDLVEWRGRGAALEPQERASYEALVAHEHWLLDQRDFEDWYQLYASQCVYWMPANLDMPDPATGDPQTQVAIAFDDRRRMGDRIVWLRTGVASSQLPVSRTTHMSGGFARVPSANPAEVKIRSSFVMHEARAHHPIQTLSGWMGHVFVEEDGSLKIARKLVCLLDANRGRHNPTFLV